MRIKQGTVISDRNDKTIVVRVDRYINHPKYQKRYRVSKKFHAHDEKNEAGIGDVVEITETRPLSKLKNWKLQKISTKGAREVVEAPAAVEHASEAELRAVAQTEKTVVEQKPTVKKDSSAKPSKSAPSPDSKAPKKTEA